MRRVVAFDTETDLIAPGLLAPPPVSVAWSEAGQETKLALVDDALEEFVGFLLNPGVTLVGHNVAYDLAVLCGHAPNLVPLVFRAFADGRIRDTKVRQELLDIASGRRSEGGKHFVWRDHKWVVADYSLAGLLMLYGGRDRTADKEGEESWRLRYRELRDVPVDQWPADARKYALDDATDTRFVYESQGENVTNEDEQARAAWALHLMACWGIRTDGPRVEALKSSLLEEREKNRARLIEVGYLVPKRCTAEEVRNGKTEFTRPAIKKATKKQIEAGDFDGIQDGIHFKRLEGKEVPYRFAKSMEAITAAVVEAYTATGQVLPKTESGRVSTDKDTLNRSGNPDLALLGDAGGVDKILNTYVPVLERGAFVPINPRFNVLVNSGRTSCSEPNLQNLPTGRKVGGVRECFIPRPGYYFVSVDYGTLELRALAQICLDWFGFSVMADALRAGQDLHLRMAADMMGISYEEAARRKKDPEVKKNRDAAKVANFGFPGGLGPEALVDYARTGYGVTLTLEQAADLKAAWLRTWPEMKLYFDRISNMVGWGDADIEQLYSGRIRGGVGYTDGCNTFFQGLAADGAKHACFLVAYECYVDVGTALYGCRPVAFIHDELILEVPIENAHWASWRLTEVMCSAMAEWITDVPVTAEPALMARWWKNAELVTDETGSLIPWEPPVAAVN